MLLSKLTKPYVCIQTRNKVHERTNSFAQANNTLNVMCITLCS